MNSQIANKLYNPVLSTDSYKYSHHQQTVPGTTKTYSHLTPRSTKRLQKNIPTLDNKIVSFGLQYTVKHLLDEWNTYFFNLPWEEVNATVLDVLAPHIGFTAANMEKFKALHTLGYLPLEIKGIPEGDRVSAGIPLLTITNTHDDFDWLPNFLESKILNTSYIPFTVATLAYELAKLRDKYWNISVDSEAGKEFALHDFHFRGAHTSYAAAISSMAYTLITKGTDTVNSIPTAQYYYNTKNPISFSIPATEHSTASLGIAYYGKLVYEAFVDTQGDTFEDLLENILIQAELLELKADPTAKAKAAVVESSLEKGRGPVATIIVQNGTLRVGDNIVCDTTFGRVKAITDDNGKRHFPNQISVSFRAKVLYHVHHPKCIILYFHFLNKYQFFSLCYFSLVIFILFCFKNKHYCHK